MVARKTEPVQDLPSLDYAKKSLDYIITTNGNNENRLNLYVTLNVGLIGALGFLYRGFAPVGLLGVLILILAGASLLALTIGLALALSVSKSRVYDPDSRMITRWIAGVDRQQITSEDANTIVWIARRMFADPKPLPDHDGYENYLTRVRQDMAADAHWEVRSVLRETYALAHVVRDRAIGLKYVRRVFTTSIVLAALTIVLDIVVRLLGAG